MIGSIRFRAASSALPSRFIDISDQGSWSQLESCLVFELKRLGLKVEEQKPLPVVYKDVKLDCGYRLDLVVEDEIKAVEKLLPIHEAQLLSYLRLAKKRVGLLMNFHVPVLKNGLKRIVNEFPDSEWEKRQAQTE
jgi:GxxExxY protein